MLMSKYYSQNFSEAFTVFNFHSEHEIIFNKIKGNKELLLHVSVG
jgi:hypothetical protein